MSWTHPTGSRPKTVSLIGLGPTHHDYDQAFLAPQTPDPVWKVDEVWTINRGLMNIRHDMAFVMDHLGSVTEDGLTIGEAALYPVYGAAMWHHDKPIITSDNCTGWPEHVKRYPFDEIWSWMQSWQKRSIVNAFGEEIEAGGPPVHYDWCVNSVVFMMWYAAWLGVREVRCWGLDYHHHKSGRVEDGHPNVAYWVGVMEREVGMKVQPFDQSTFLDAGQRSFFYGYQNDPRPNATMKRSLFRRLAKLDATEEGLAPPSHPAEV